MLPGAPGDRRLRDHRLRRARRRRRGRHPGDGPGILLSRLRARRHARRGAQGPAGQGHPPASGSAASPAAPALGASPRPTTRSRRKPPTRAASTATPRRGGQRPPYSRVAEDKATSARATVSGASRTSGSGPRWPAGDVVTVRRAWQAASLLVREEPKFRVATPHQAHSWMPKTNQSPDRMRNLIEAPMLVP